MKKTQKAPIFRVNFYILLQILANLGKNITGT